MNYDFYILISLDKIGIIFFLICYERSEYILLNGTCNLSENMPVNLPQSKRFLRGRYRQKRPFTNRIRLLIVYVVTRKCLPTVCIHSAGMPGAWPSSES